MFRVAEGKAYKKDAKGGQSAAFLDTAGLTVESAIHGSFVGSDAPGRAK